MKVVLDSLLLDCYHLKDLRFGIDVLDLLQRKDRVVMGIRRRGSVRRVSDISHVPITAGFTLGSD
jgi:hypothetical protein